MLVLTRRRKESFWIGEDIKITILSTDGGKVRVGIDAPQELVVHREEVMQRIWREQADQARIEAEVQRRLREAGGAP